MKTRLIYLLLLLAWLPGRAGVTIISDPLYRSVISNWTDIGSISYPFKSIYAGELFVDGASVPTAVGFTNTVTLPAGASAYVTNLGVIAGVWTFQAGIPAGMPGTNTVTAYSLSNSVLSSTLYVATNINPLNFSGSNYIGKFAQIYNWLLVAPNLGGGGISPGTNEQENVTFSFTGTNGWFYPTNLVYGGLVYSNVYVAVVGAAGSSGALTIYGIDHPELYGRTNSFYGQYNRFPAPLDPNDAANKNYVDTQIANALTPFSAWTDATNLYHVSLNRNNQTLVDFTAAGIWIPIDGFTSDGTGTNGLLTIAQTNLLAGWNLQSSTNLLLANGWTTFTNYSMATNSGEVTFTIPYNFNISAQFYRAMLPGNNRATFNATPLAVNGAAVSGGGVLQLYATTNTPTISDLGNQAGGRLWVSNGTFYATGSTNGSTTYTKLLAP